MPIFSCWDLIKRKGMIIVWIKNTEQQAVSFFNTILKYTKKQNVLQFSFLCVSQLFSYSPTQKIIIIISTDTYPTFFLNWLSLFFFIIMFRWKTTSDKTGSVKKQIKKITSHFKVIEDIITSHEIIMHELKKLCSKTLMKVFMLRRKAFTFLHKILFKLINLFKFQFVVFKKIWQNGIFL